MSLKRSHFGKFEKNVMNTLFLVLMVEGRKEEVKAKESYLKKKDENKNESWKIFEFVDLSRYMRKNKKSCIEGKNKTKMFFVVNFFEGYVTHCIIIFPWRKEKNQAQD